MRRQRKTACIKGKFPDLRRVAVLSVVCAFGILLGYFAACRMSDQSVEQLQSYLLAYAKLQIPAGSGVTLLRALAVYFRYCLLMFLLSFNMVGCYLIPLVFVLQGFSLSFAATAFFGCFSVSTLAVLSLFGFRAVIMLPVSLYFGSAAMQMSANRDGGISSGFWRRLGICICALLLGSVLETAVVPHLFPLLFPI